MRHSLICSVLVVALAGAACGGPEPAGGKDPAGSAPTAKAPAAEAPVTHDGRPIEITANDAIQFSLNEITAAPGERLSVTLVNVGSMPKFSMGHNFVLLALEADVAKFLTDAAASPTTDYIPEAQKEMVLAATRLLGPGERDTVTFNAPSKPGRYEFLCSFSGHYQVGMKGVLIVQ